MRVRRLLLFVLVALDLTLVCQGHGADGSHTGVHFALLGEPHPEGPVEHPPPEKAGRPHEPGLGRAQDHARGADTSLFAPGEGGRNSDPALLSVDHFSALMTLAVALLGAAGGTAPTLSLRMADRLTWMSRTGQPPESPPPQFSV